MVNSLQQFVDTFEALGDPNAVYEYVLDFGSQICYFLGIFLHRQANCMRHLKRYGFVRVCEH